VEYVPEVERGMGKFDIQFCPTSHIFPKSLVSAERYCSIAVSHKHKSQIHCLNDKTETDLNYKD